MRIPRGGEVDAGPARARRARPAAPPPRARGEPGRRRRRHRRGTGSPCTPDPPRPPITCSWVASTTTRPSGSTSICTLGVVKRVPVTSSSTTPPVGEVVEVPVRQRLERGAEVAGRAEVDHLVAVAGAAVVVLDHHARGVGPLPLAPTRRPRGRRRCVRTSSQPAATGTPASLNSRRPALLKPSGHRRGDGSVDRRVQLAAATATSWSVTFHGSMNAGRPPIRRRSSSTRSGRSSSFSAIERWVESGTSSTCRRRRAEARRSAGISEK